MLLLRTCRQLSNRSTKAATGGMLLLRRQQRDRALQMMPTLTARLTCWKIRVNLCSNLLHAHSVQVHLCLNGVLTAPGRRVVGGWICNGVFAYAQVDVEHAVRWCPTCSRREEGTHLKLLVDTSEVGGSEHIMTGDTWAHLNGGCCGVWLFFGLMVGSGNHTDAKVLVPMHGYQHLHQHCLPARGYSST